MSELGAIMALDGNVEARCRSFYGYLVKVRGMGMRQAKDVRQLLDPSKADQRLLGLSGHPPVEVCCSYGDVTLMGEAKTYEQVQVRETDPCHVAPAHCT